MIYVTFKINRISSRLLPFVSGTDMRTYATVSAQHIENTPMQPHNLIPSKRIGNSFTRMKVSSQDMHETNVIPRFRICKQNKQKDIEHGNTQSHICVATDSLRTYLIW